MMDFLDALRQSPLLQRAVLAGLLASVVCGIMGTYVVTRRITFISGGIAHCVLGGMGIAYFLHNAHGWAIEPIHGAIIAAVSAAIVIGLVSLHAEQHEDMVIGAVWAVGMAVGVIFMYLTPGYNTDLMSYLFGDILMVGARDIYVMIALDVLIVLIVVLLYNKFLAVCFDSEFALLRRMNVQGYYLLLLCLIALTVVIMIHVVGLILVIALLTLPAAIARQASRTLARMMVIASILGAVFTSGGMALSHEMQLPPGATIVLIAGAAFLVCLGIKKCLRLRRRQPDDAETAETY